MHAEKQATYAEIRERASDFMQHKMKNKSELNILNRAVNLPKGQEDELKMMDDILID